MTLRPGNQENIAMKITAILLVLPLALGSGAAFAETTTSSDSVTINSGMPASSTESRTKIEHQGLLGDKTVEKSRSSTVNPDGSVSTEKSKSVTHD
jgi:hypothetical protein